MTVRTTFVEVWAKHYGWPEIAVCDQGPEFTGVDWMDYLGGHGVMVHATDSQSPWQNGRTERAGGLLKQQVQDVLHQCAGATRQELVTTSMSEAVDARSRYVNRFGYSAHQRVFGSSLRLPSSLLSDDPVDRCYSPAQATGRL